MAELAFKSFFYRVTVNCKIIPDCISVLTVSVIHQCLTLTENAKVLSHPSLFVTDLFVCLFVLGKAVHNVVTSKVPCISLVLLYTKKLYVGPE